MTAPIAAALIASLRALGQSRQGLPGSVEQHARVHLADTLGIAVAARSTAAADRVKAAMGTAEGGACRLIGGGKAGPAAAAFVNAALIHIQDFDDIHDVGRLHPAPVILPAALACAQLVDASDAEVLEAFSLGCEWLCRMGKACSPEGSGRASEWFLTQLLGYAAAAYAAGLVLKLTDAQMVSGVGLACMQAAGSKEAGFGTGSTARAVYPAFAAMGGVQAALMARAGMDGPAGGLDGTAGLFKVYLGSQLTAAQRELLLDADTWHWLETDIKPWPCCRLSQPYVAAALAGRKRLGEELPARIRVAVNASAAKLCRPLPARRRPRTLQDARYSIPFMTAFALACGEPTLQSLSEASLDDEAVHRLVDRLEIEETLADRPGHPMAELRLSTARGNSIVECFHPDMLAMPAEAVQAKFRDCLRFAGVEADADALWQGLMSPAIPGGIGAILDALATTVHSEVLHV